MTAGIMVCHCFNDMVTEIEQEVFSNIKTLLGSFNGPVIGTMNQRKDILELIPSGKNYQENFMDSQHHGIILQWINQYKIDTVYLVGCHYNLCIRRIFNEIEECVKHLPQDQYTKFSIHIVKECTAAVSDLDNNCVLNMADYEKTVDQVYDLIALTDVNG